MRLRQQSIKEPQRISLKPSTYFVVANDVLIDRGFAVKTKWRRSCKRLYIRFIYTFSYIPDPVLL